MMRKKTLSVLAILACICALIMAVVALSAAFGYRPYILLTGSMEPTYSAGSLVWIDTHYHLEDLRSGDVIAYKNDVDYVIMHRLLQVLPDSGTSAETLAEVKGDANEISQSVTLTGESLVGRAVWAIPKLGKMFNILRKQRYVVILISGVLIVLALFAKQI